MAIRKLLCSLLDTYFRSARNLYESFSKLGGAQEPKILTVAWRIYLSKSITDLSIESTGVVMWSIVGEEIFSLRAK